MTLIGFEESQTITERLLDKGIEAYSCDIKPTSGKYENYHLQMDIFQALQLKKWTTIILHPPCTYTCLSGNRWYADTSKREEGIELCKKSWEISKSICKFVALEQPATIMQKYIGPKTQIIHPWQFGHGEVKATWLWLHNLPNLIPTNIVDGREERIWKLGKTQDRGTIRSKTYPGIAEAIVSQWFNK